MVKEHHREHLEAMCSFWIGTRRLLGVVRTVVTTRTRFRLGFLPVSATLMLPSNLSRKRIGTIRRVDGSPIGDGFVQACRYVGRCDLGVPC